VRKKGPFQVGHEVLIVDDEQDIRELVAGILEDDNYETRTASDSDTALKEIEARMPTLLILDIWLQGSRLDGLEILDQVKSDHPDLPVIMISGHGNIETAVSAIKKGAYDFIEKPFKADELLLTVERAIETSRLKRENLQLKSKLGTSFELVGSSPQISQLRQVIDRVAPTGSRVLITGPSGSGKEMVAQLIHQRSGRAYNPFVAINAAAMAPERFEKELFGIEKDVHGSRKIGLFEQAHGGTLFLDEVGDMSLSIQAKFLRVLEGHAFERVGGGTPISVDVRIVAATNRDLEKAIEEKTFRQDLFFRLFVMEIAVPPLRDHASDIPVLANHFLRKFTSRASRRVEAFSDAAMQALIDPPAPGCHWRVMKHRL